MGEAKRKKDVGYIPESKKVNTSKPKVISAGSRSGALRLALLMATLGQYPDTRKFK